MHKSFEILLIDISTVRLSDLERYCHWKIAALNAKNPLSSPCTSLHKHEQKDRTKTLAKFPDHVSIDYDAKEMKLGPRFVKHRKTSYNTVQ